MTIQTTNTSTFTNDTDNLVKLGRIGQPRYIRVVNARTKIEIRNLDGILENTISYSDMTVWKLN